MNPEQEHETIRHFQSLRAAVERSVPPFSATIDRALRRQESPKRAWRDSWRVRAAIVAMVCAMVVGAAMLARREKARPASQQVLAKSLERWTSPTDFLLETPGRELLRETPRIESTTFYSERKLP